jgi:homoserine/homoserine lactone efflux protein
MTVESWLLFTAVFFLATIAPGPGMLLAMAHAMAHGRKRFFVTAAGQILASLIQTAISLAGLGAIMMSSVLAFEIVRWSGALYLVYLGFKIWRTPVTSFNNQLPSSATSSKTHVSNSKLFRESFLVCLGNPKAIVFFGSLFPQFISPQNVDGISLMILMTSMTSVIVICVFIWASGGRYIAGWLKNSKAQKYFNRAMGGCFITAGIGVAASR